MSEPTPRQLPCLIEAFLEYTDALPSPYIFRKWAALALVAGAVTRKVWLKASDSTLFPNQLIVLIAPPGVGKGMAIWEVQDLWASTGKFNLAPMSLTRAGFEDALGDRPQIVEIDKVPKTLNCLVAAIPEFGTLFSSHDLEFFNKVNDIYDCRSIYSYRTRGGGEVNVANPYFHMIAGTQPGFLGELLPETAFKMGFTSRLLLIFGAEKRVVTIFGKPGKDKKLKQAIVSDLQHLADLTGGMRVEDDAVKAIEAWHARPEPIPDHNRLQNYNPRRIIHVLKMTMALSIARRSDLIIKLRDFEEAKEMLLYAEAMMPEIFKDMSSQSDSQFIGEAFNYVWKVYAARKKPVLEQNLVAFVHGLVPVQKVEYIIEALFKSGMVEQAEGLFLPVGQRRIVPRSKSLHGQMEYAEEAPAVNIVLGDKK